MKVKIAFKINKELFNKVLIKTGEHWIRCELEEDYERILVPPISGIKTLATLVSGSASNLHDEDYGLSTIGGIDRLRIESKPKKGEPPINIDHFAVCNGEDPENYDVFYIIPQNGDNPEPFEHWPDSNQVDKIIDSIEKTIKDI